MCPVLYGDGTAESAAKWNLAAAWPALSSLPTPFWMGRTLNVRLLALLWPDLVQLYRIYVVSDAVQCTVEGHLSHPWRISRGLRGRGGAVNGAPMESMVEVLCWSCGGCCCPPL